MKITEAGRSTPDVRILGAVCAASGVMPRRASRAAPNKGRRLGKGMGCVLIGGREQASAFQSDILDRREALTPRGRRGLSWRDNLATLPPRLVFSQRLSMPPILRLY